MKPKISFDEYYVKNLNEYNSIIQTLILDHREIYFRGQSQAKYKLVPSIARGMPKDFKPKLHEVELYTAFRRRMAVYKEETFREYTSISTQNNLETIAIAQHNGLKTRLLDWSTNPLTSLYFSCENSHEIKSDSQEDPYCIIWVLVAPEDRAIRNQFFFNDEDTNKKMEDLVELPETKMYVPTIVNPRIKNQSGLFSVIHFEHENKSYIPFEENEKFFAHKFSGNAYDMTKDWNMMKILINRKLYGVDIERNLRRFDIHKETIYPGLESLGKRLSFDFENGFVQ